MFRILEL